MLQSALQKTRTGYRWAAYDLSKPERAQRNRVVSISTATTLEQFATSRALAQAGFGDIHQTRALICDDDLLLTWIGGFHQEPLAPKARRTFEDLVPHIRRRLVAERALFSHGMLERGLEAALEEIGRPAYLVDTEGRIGHANAIGRQATPSELRALSEDVAQAGVPGRCYKAIKLQTRSARDHYLLVRRAPQLDDAVISAARDWKLTPRQLEVLRLIVRGDANKTIAERLGCALRTVEVHVGAILVKSGVDGRAAVIAKVLSRDK